MTPNPNPIPTPTPTPMPSGNGNGNNAWVVQAGGVEPVPNGAYLATFDGVSEYANPDKGIAGKWRWAWTIVSGAQTGKVISALTDMRLTPGTHAGRLIAGMNGKALAVGDDVRMLVESFKGRKFLCVVQPGPKGGKASVQSASPPPEM